MKTGIAVILLTAFLTGCPNNGARISSEPSGAPIAELIAQIESALDEVSSHRPSGLPPLNRITLTLETFAKRDAKGSVGLYVVTVDGSVSESAIQTITLTLQPPPPVSGQPRILSNLAIKDILGQAIIHAANETATALRDRKDLSLAELTASIKFVVEQSADAEAKFNVLPVNLSAKGSQVRSTTNVINVTFKSFDQKPTEENAGPHLPHIPDLKPPPLKPAP